MLIPSEIFILRGLCKAEHTHTRTHTKDPVLPPCQSDAAQTPVGRLLPGVLAAAGPGSAGHLGVLPPSKSRAPRGGSASRSKERQKAKGGQSGAQGGKQETHHPSRLAGG